MGRDGGGSDVAWKSRRVSNSGPVSKEVLSVMSLSLTERCNNSDHRP